MKTNTTDSTKHPHEIEEPAYFNAIKKRKRVGISFVTAFVLVLAIHLAGVGGIFAFSNPKSDKKPTAVVEAPAEKQLGPKSDSLARTEGPKPEAQPKDVATPPLFNVDDSAARKAFLATRSNSQPVTQTQQAIPVAFRFPATT